LGRFALVLNNHLLALPRIVHGLQLGLLGACEYELEKYACYAEACERCTDYECGYSWEDYEKRN